VEVNQINQLMLTMRRRGIKKLLIKKDNFEIQLELEDKVPLRGIDVMSDTLDENPMRSDFERHRYSGPVMSQDAPKQGLKNDADAAKEDTLSLYVTSPMVGTLYHSPSPNDPSFVKIGDRVEKNTVVCIIEAMKVMNEVKAGVQGIVAEILVDNSSPVEFGTKVLRVTPTS
jgi:acetyl-CoA carboxylase biotin carboxyl carrier protein